MLGKFFTWIFAAITIGFIASASYVFFSEVVFNAKIKNLNTILGGFTGAFFAFLFIRLADALTRIYERKSKNRSALVRYQHIFNDYLGIYGDNIFVTDGLHDLVDKIKTKNKPLPVYINKLEEFPIDKDLPIQLTNIDLINEIFSLNVSIRKLNDTMATFDRLHDLTRTMFTEKKINPETYIDNILSMEKAIKDIRSFLDSLKEDLVAVTAATRILSEDDSLLGQFIIKTTKTRYASNFDELRKEEIERLNKEIFETRESSRKKIDDVLEKQENRS